VPGKTPGIKIIYTSPSLSCPHDDRRWASTFGRPITKGPSTFGPSKYLAHNQNQQSHHTWPITKIMILLVFLASLTSEKVITLIDLREGYSQSCHGSKQQRVANIDHRILHAKLCKSAKLTFFANFAYLSKIAISNLMPKGFRT